MKQAILQGTRETLCLEEFKCDFLTFYPHYIYLHYLQKYQQECKAVIYNYVLCLLYSMISCILWDFIELGLVLSL